MSAVWWLWFVVVVEGLGLCEAKKKGSRARKERGAGLPACGGWRRGLVLPL